MTRDEHVCPFCEGRPVTPDCAICGGAGTLPDATDVVRAMTRDETPRDPLREAAEDVIALVPVASIEPLTQGKRNLEARKEAAIARLRALVASATDDPEWLNAWEKRQASGWRFDGKVNVTNYTPSSTPDALDVEALAPRDPLPWADNAAAALDELDRLYYDGAGPTVAEYRAATDAVRTAIDALASSTQDAAKTVLERYAIDRLDASERRQQTAYDRDSELYPGDAHRAARLASSTQDALDVEALKARVMAWNTTTRGKQPDKWVPRSWVLDLLDDLSARGQQ